MVALGWIGVVASSLVPANERGGRVARVVGKD